MTTDTTVNTVFQRVHEDYENWSDSERINLFLSLSDIKKLFDDTEFQGLLIGNKEFNFYAKLFIKESFIHLNANDRLPTFEGLEKLYNDYKDHTIRELLAVIIYVLLSEPFKRKQWFSQDDLWKIFLGQVVNDHQCQGLASLVWHEWEKKK